MHERFGASLPIEPLSEYERNDPIAPLVQMMNGGLS